MWNSDRCCIVIACGCIIAALHFALGCTEGREGRDRGRQGEGLVPDEAATMISTTSKPIRSCNIFTHRVKGGEGEAGRLVCILTHHSVA